MRVRPARCSSKPSAGASPRCRRRSSADTARSPGAADPGAAVQAAVTLEAVAQMALLTVALNPDAGPLASFVRDKHYERKHGPGAYYGQR